MDQDIEEFIPEDSLKKRIKEMALQLTEEFKEKNPIFIAVLKGSFMFYADLLKELDFPLEVDFIKASSYGNATVSSGKVNLEESANADVNGRDVVIVEDIVDTGRTLQKIVGHVKGLGANSVTTVTLLDKPVRREVEITPDYTGFVIEDKYVVGYGMDVAEKGRNLPFIGVLN